eukprot:2862731-Pyramimonas_sp.AAC.1
MLLIKKQLKNVGVPHWDELSSPTCPHAHLSCTDAGGDIKAARANIASDVSVLNPMIMFLDIDCLMHQSSLGTVDSLKVADSVLSRLTAKQASLAAMADVDPAEFPQTYSSSLMKVMNTWREHAATLYFIWKDIDCRSCHMVETMPPRMIPTRWGTKDACEELILSLPRDTFIESLRLTLDKRTRTA